MEVAKLTSRRPYLLRAMRQWMIDNALTPHIVVDATVDGVSVPESHVHGGKIVLNISEGATTRLALGNDSVEFSARFGGVVYDVLVPVRAVLGIYARESGQGMIFTDNEGPEPPAGRGEKPERRRKRRSHLKIVK